ncbi:MAG: hypothetical protein VXW22_13210, partial [Pseudomonadota bacterium]|nr:hypothetical protein [Pseudomonadota bacterium]
VVDVWGNALAVESGFTSPDQSRSIFEFFSDHQNEIFFEGQVRETPSPAQWDYMHDYQHNTYSSNLKSVLSFQNGGYRAFLLFLFLCSYFTYLFSS